MYNGRWIINPNTPQDYPPPISWEMQTLDYANWLEVVRVELLLPQKMYFFASESMLEAPARKLKSRGFSRYGTPFTPRFCGSSLDLGKLTKLYDTWMVSHCVPVEVLLRDFDSRFGTDDESSDQWDE